ncbi:MAG: hypothetical protein JWQ09_4396 [Segetibacter sp.]|nr:hypothetical protein [Segetibacter sp.]
MTKKLTYSEKLLSPLWQKKRLSILERDNWACKKCGDKETTLHVHHIEYDGYKDPWTYDDEQMYCICSDCHSFLHDLENGSKYHEFSFFKIKQNDDTIFFIKSKNGSICIFSFSEKLRQIIPLPKSTNLLELSKFISI